MNTVDEVGHCILANYGGFEILNNVAMMCWQSQSCHEQAGIVLPDDVLTMYVATCRRNDGVFDLCRNINERLLKSAKMYT